MSDQEKMSENISGTEETAAATEPAKTGESNVAGPEAQSHKKGKRYQGYDVNDTRKKRAGRKKPWFWKILGISLLLSLIIVVVACVFLVKTNKKQSAHLSEINEANTMDALLEGHKNVTIICSYSHLAEGNDYTTTRQVTRTKDGEYYSYLKVEGTYGDYKEVIRNKKLYRYDERFARYYGMIDGDYEDVCVAEIEGSVFQTSDKDKIETEKESSGLINIKAYYTVQDGDEYSTKYGFAAGSRIEKTITMDKESMIVTSETESCDEEEFYSYLVEYDGETKIPNFYRTIQKETETRECTVYYDFEGDNSKVYHYDVPYDVYFVMLDHKGTRVYMDSAATQEFTDYQVEIQNPEGPLTLYVTKEKEQ